MRAFARLLERLLLTPSRNRKIDLVANYLRATPDPDRGYALAAITGGLELKSVKPALVRELVSETVDPELFRLSYDFVGDLAETVALIWPSASSGPDTSPTLNEVVTTLVSASLSTAPVLLRNLLDRLPASERLALIKLATGGLRVGLSAALARQALAQLGNKEANEIEELWHGLSPPYANLFAWLDGLAEKPANAAAAPFRPVMLAHALEDRDIASIQPDAFAVEWKWDGIRVQAVSDKGARRLYSRTGDDISGAFPDVVAAMDFEGALDGELLVGRPDASETQTGTFSDLQQRLNRKTVSGRQLQQFPAFIRAYDLLVEGNEDLRGFPYIERRARLAGLVAQLDPARFDLSPQIPFADIEALAKLRATPPHPVIEGLMLKRLDGAYLAGRPKGHWYKWKKDPLSVDAVLMYAQRGHGKRSGYFSDFTFGVWRAAELVPVGKAYFGFTDSELKQLDKFVRENTVERFGPVSAVKAGMDFGLVLEIAFEGLNRSNRHKSGIAMRFPRIARIRFDKPPREADRIETLERMLQPIP